MATRAILGPASVYTSHVSPVVNVVAASAPKKVSLHLDGDDVTGVIVPTRES